MEKLFVPYEMVLKLKIKGFNEPCLAFYRDKQLLFSSEMYNCVSVQQEDLEHDCDCLAPTYQQIIDWARDTKDLYPVVFPTTSKDRFCAILYRTPNNEIYQSIERFDDYYEALNRLIKEILILA